MSGTFDELRQGLGGADRLWGDKGLGRTDKPLDTDSAIYKTFITHHSAADDAFPFPYLTPADFRRGLADNGPSLIDFGSHCNCKYSPHPSPGPWPWHDHTRLLPLAYHSLTLDACLLAGYSYTLAASSALTNTLTHTDTLVYICPSYISSLTIKTLNLQ